MTSDGRFQSIPRRWKPSRAMAFRLLVIAALIAIGAAAWLGGGLRSSRWFAARDAGRPAPSGVELLEMMIEYHKMEAATCLGYAKSGRRRAGRLTLDSLKSLGSAAWGAYLSRAGSRRPGEVETPHPIQGSGGFRDFEDSLTAAREQVRSAEGSDLLAQYHLNVAAYYAGLLASGATELPPSNSPVFAALHRPSEERLKRYGLRVVPPPPEPTPLQLLGLVPRKGDTSFVPPFTAAPTEGY